MDKLQLKKGWSTLLNLIHEKLDAGATALFKENRLMPTEASVANGVAIDGISEQGVVEFLQQNEIEQFATDHKRLTAAIFVRLRKLDAKGILSGQELAVDVATGETERQFARVRNHYTLSIKLLNAEKELGTQKGLVESIQTDDYRSINAQLSTLNKELITLRNDRGRLENLWVELRALTAKHVMPEARELNAYETHIKLIVQTIEQAILASEQSDEIKDATKRETEVEGAVSNLKQSLETYLKERGLSAENLADVGMATERVARLEQEISDTRARLLVLETEIVGFTSQRNAATDYLNAVKELLAPINEELKGVSSEIKPIELQYTFDLGSFRQLMIQYVAGALGQIEARAARTDYVEGKLKEINFTQLGSREEVVAKIPDDSTIYSKALREFFGQEVNFETFKLQVELRLLDVKNLGQIRVLYDKKPVENSSFGQRCTAVIVVLLLLGNMPIVIDEPEAHLDSSLIAKYLVDLIKSRKQHRQIIFATHNANFVINGDAELIHCMSMDDSKITKIVSTTIENLEHRKMLLALEGGEEAFHQREKRYSFG